MKLNIMDAYDDVDFSEPSGDDVDDDHGHDVGL